MNNPFSLIFGRSPIASIERPVQTNEITEAFQSETINQQLFLITGVRGYGKTLP